MTGPACTITEHAAPGFDLKSIMLEDCTRVEFNIALNEFERQRAGIGHRIETWPAEVRVKLEREAEKWLAERSDRVPRLVSSCVWRGVCVLIVHHSAK